MHFKLNAAASEIDATLETSKQAEIPRPKQPNRSYERMFPDRLLGAYGWIDSLQPMVALRSSLGPLTVQAKWDCASKPHVVSLSSLPHRRLVLEPDSKQGDR